MILKKDHQQILADIDWYHNQSFHDFGIKSNWNDGLLAKQRFEYNPVIYTPPLHKIRKHREIGSILAKCCEQTNDVLYASVTPLNIDRTLQSKFNLTLLSVIFILNPPVSFPEKFDSVLHYLTDKTTPINIIIAVKYKANSLLTKSLNEYAFFWQRDASNTAKGKHEK